MLFTLILLFGIFARAQSSCPDIDWLDRGWQDAMGGLSSRWSEYQKACGFSETADQGSRYKSGYRTGLATLCEPEMAYRSARLGQNFPLNICPSAVQAQLQTSFEGGQKSRILQVFTHLLGFIISIATVFLFLFVRNRFRSGQAQNKNLSILIFSLVALVSGLCARLCFFNVVGSGNYVFEELSILIYIENMLSGVRTYSGATNMTFFLGMAGWKYLFGPGLLEGRALTTIISLIGLVFFYRGTKNLTDRSTALSATGLASISLYGCYLSRLAIETSWPLAFFALTLFLYSKISQDQKNNLKSNWFAFLLGFSFALGIFTYPGYTLWLISAASVFSLVKLKRRKLNIVALSFLSIGFLIYFLPTLAFHLHSQADVPLLRGGGAFVKSFESYWNELPIQFYDLFVSAESYYLQQGGSFIESGLWGFFLIGVWRLVCKERQDWAIALLASMIASPFLSALAPNLPGMRRGIVFLYLFYLFAGNGMAVFLGLLGGSTPAFRKFGYGLSLIALLLSIRGLAYSIYKNASEIHYNGFAELIEKDQTRFNSWLQNENLVILQSGYVVNDFVGQFLRAYSNLSQRHSGIPTKNFSVRSAKEGYFPADVHSKNYIFILDDPRLVKVLDSNFCVKSSQSFPHINNLYLVEVDRCQPFFEKGRGQGAL